MAKPIRIEELHLRFFLAHRSTDLDLRKGGLFVLTGAFGDGKTAVRDAIEFLLLGSARGHLRKDNHRLAYDATRFGLPAPESPPRMGVKGVIRFGDDAQEVQRTPKGESHSKGRLADLLGLPDLDALEALLEVSRFPTFDTERRLRLIDRVLGTPLTLKDLDAAGIDDTDVQVAALKSIKSGKAKATDKRRSEEGAAEGCAADPPEDAYEPMLKKNLSGVDIAALQEKIKQVEAARDALLGEVEGAKGHTAGLREAREEAVRVAEKALAEAVERARAARVARNAMAEGDLAKKAAEAKKVRDTLAPLIEESKEALKKRSAARDAARSAADKAAGMLAGAGKKAKDGPCPTCGQPTTAAALLAHLQKVAEKAGKDLAAAEKAVTEQKADQDDLLGKDQEAKDTMDAWTGDMGDAEDVLDRALEAEKAATKALSKAKADLEAAQVAPAGPDPAKEAELKKKTEGLANARGILARVQAYRVAAGEWEKRKTEKARHLAAAARYRKMEEILSEDGILATRSVDSLAAIRKKMEEQSAIALPAGRVASIGEGAVLLWNGAPAEEGSHGEQFVTSALFAAALASLSGLRFIFLDNLVPVDAEERDRVFRMLIGLIKAGEIQQAFVVTLRNHGVCGPCGLTLAYSKKGCPKCGGALRPPLPKGPLAEVMRTFEFTGPGELVEAKWE